jgi:hypothetical protein
VLAAVAVVAADQELVFNLDHLKMVVQYQEHEEVAAEEVELDSV